MERPKCANDLPLVFGPLELSQIMGMSLTKAYEIGKKSRISKNSDWSKILYRKRAFYWLAR